MQPPPPSPRILHSSWGRLEIEGQPAPFKDAKLYPGGARAWDWRETGTDHSPGVQPADIQELLDHGARVVVLSLGALGRLEVPAETLRWLEAQGVRAHVCRTAEAVALYNRLRESSPLGALIHSTC